MVGSTLPHEAGGRSAALLAKLHAIIARDGQVAFPEFMQTALYDRDGGYYGAALSPIFGAQGDFVTSPEMGGLFASCLAGQCAQVLRQLPDADILEFGAGSGKLALDLLFALQRLGCEPKRYLIDEISPALRQRQQRLLRQWQGKTSIEWLQSPLQQPFDGVVLANEVVDALPFHCLVWRGGRWLERYVGNGGAVGEFIWRELPLSASAQPHVPSLPVADGDYCDGYLSECRSNIASWLDTATGVLRRGLLLCMDYGYPRNEYLHPQRYMGTMLCHRGHSADDDPLSDVGCKDITASVDFTALAEVAETKGLDLYGYTTQAGFLLSLAADKLAASERDRKELGALLYHGAMGERFKVLALAKGLRDIVAPPGAGFAKYDHRWRL